MQAITLIQLAVAVTSLLALAYGFYTGVLPMWIRRLAGFEEYHEGIYPWVDRTTLARAWDDTGGDAAWVGLGATWAGIAVGLVA